MDHHTNYMPILRSKQTEFDSLGLLADKDRPLITPLLDVVPDAMTVKKQRNVSEGLLKVAHLIGQNWRSYPLCVDVRHLGVLSPGLTGRMLMMLCSALRQPVNSMFPDWRIPICRSQD